MKTILISFLFLFVSINATEFNPSSKYEVLEKLGEELDEYLKACCGKISVIIGPLVNKKIIIKLKAALKIDSLKKIQTLSLSIATRNIGNKKFDINKLYFWLLCKAIAYDANEISKIMIAELKYDISHFEKTCPIIVLAGATKNKEITKLLISHGASFDLKQIREKLQKFKFQDKQIDSICEFITECFYETGLTSKNSNKFYL